MSCFITGASGFIGSKLALALAGEGQQVHVLLRNPELSPELDHPDIKIFRGDILDIQSIESCMQGCQTVFHLAAFAQPFSRDPDLPYRVNVAGTRNVLASALKHAIRKVVFVSSAATIQPSNGNPSTEATKRTLPYFNAYESTKAEAEQASLEFAGRGLPVVIVNPTRVYGPGKLNKSNSTTIMIRDYSLGKWRIIPGNGRSIGNYAYIDDIVAGIILAAEKGRAGERYILGGSNLSFNELFEILGELTGIRRIMIGVPYPVMWTIVGFMQLFSRMSGKPPLITLPWLRKYLDDWEVSSEKARTELGFEAIPFREGAKRTLEWLKNHDEQTFRKP